ncbi:porin family protein [uncultured Chitinophaga sp.]|jgi:hypothetical protein|uniref:porin family protein n=1 Tax=uncultured Chitinophaga sp. TaxID=339340 RepID=UPI002633A210|nr:porin family protein [uncultured Chitinophaga sp.]
MKNFTYLLFLAILAGQPLHAQISIGFRGGYTLADMRYKDATIGYKYNGLGTPTRLNSWHVDFMVNMPVKGGLYIQPLLRYNTVGAQFEPPAAVPAGVFMPSAREIRLHYLELPLNVVYKIPFSFGKLVTGAGPYAGYALNGKYDLAIRYNGSVVENTHQEIRFNDRTNIVSTNSQVRRWDAGANIMLGLEFNNLVVLGANYSIGLTDIDRSVSSTLKNRYLGISLGVLLNREDY